jgi:transposase-like protein
MSNKRRTYYNNKSLREILSQDPLIMIDRGPWYRWALERFRLKYQYQRLGLRNTVERFFGYRIHKAED